MNQSINASLSVKERQIKLHEILSWAGLTIMIHDIMIMTYPSRAKPVKHQHSRVLTVLHHDRDVFVIHILGRSRSLITIVTFPLQLMIYRLPINRSTPGSSRTGITIVTCLWPIQLQIQRLISSSQDRETHGHDREQAFCRNPEKC